MDSASPFKTPAAAWLGAERYHELESRIRAALRPDLSETEFNALALEIHQFQREWNEPYGHWCATQREPQSWREIPAVPQAIFKRYRLTCFPPAMTGTTFRTSGTTGETRGEHHFLDTSLYKASVLAGWRRLQLPSLQPVILSPRAEDAPDSSLAHMLQYLAAETGQTPIWLCQADGRLDRDRITEWLRREPSAPITFLGTALGFLNLFEHLGSTRAPLAPGSFAMETGGFKGSGRDIAKPELYGMFRERLGLKPQQIWNEYGMCELSSQFYTRGLGGLHVGGPWVRAIIISPETGSEVPIGEIGVLRIFDLANLGSVLALQTADLAVRQENGFALLGRNPAALPRGCSRMADEAMRQMPLSPPPERIAKTGVHRFQAASPSFTCAQRARALAQAAAPFTFLGEITEKSLLEWVKLELGDPEVLDRFVPHGAHRVRAQAPKIILHILSSNTPAAALQTILRGLLLGSMNLCKLPASGLPEVDAFLEGLPPKLRTSVQTSTTLPDDWLAQADAIIVFGNDETVATFRALPRPGQTFIAHGHKLSLGIIFADPEFASVAGAARDASVFDQQGCLSPHVFYIHESAGCSAGDYARKLAAAMAEFETHSPRGDLPVGESNRICALREELAFRAANGEPLEIQASAENTAWTVIADHTPGFPATPLNRVIFVKPLPVDPTSEFATIQPHLSTCGVWPLTPDHAETAARLGASRICRIGDMQRPALSWHQDGQSVLASLVRWIDWEE